MSAHSLQPIVEFEELHLAMSGDTFAAVSAVLQPDDPLRPPERGVIGLTHWSRGRRRATVLLERIVRPDPDEVVWDEKHGLLFSVRYKSRATECAAGSGAGLCFLHTHPARAGSRLHPAPSLEDLETDRRDLYALGRSLKQSVPLVAGILSDNGRWAARVYEFRFPSTVAEAGDPAYGESSEITHAIQAILVVGPSLRKLATEVAAAGPAGAAGRVDLAASDSTVQLWGQSGQEQLAAIRVGLTGLGGVGGILAEHTARLGVGGQVAIDYDRLGHDNANRSQGALPEEINGRARKADVAVRLARQSATAPGFEARAIIGSVVEKEVIPDLLDCDLILNAADSPWARQVLDHLAYAHLIPVVNGGTVIVGNAIDGATHSGKCEVTVAAPGHPCFQCSRVYTLEEVTEAQTHPARRGARRYIDGPINRESVEVEERGPSVIGANALVAGLMQLRLMALVLGTTPAAVIGTQRYHVSEGVLAWGVVRACRPECGRSESTARGDTVALPIGVDLDRREAEAAMSPEILGGNERRPPS
jgi:molybdopterin/thiamine biosynthesis adenylyltransferase